MTAFSFPRSDSLLSPDQSALMAALTELPYRVSPGYGMRSLKPAEWRSLIALPDDSGMMDKLLVFEPPRSKRHRYVVSADVSNGLGLDRSSIDVIRVPTIREPAEQVAHFLTDSIDAGDLAAYLDAIGRLYSGNDDLPAVVAPEGNGSGMATINTLQKHIGYPNLYIWQVLDNRDPAKAFTTKVGWWTTVQSRRIIIETLYHALKAVDPHTGLPDYRLNSPFTIAELRTFLSLGPIWMGEAAEGAYDDCIMSSAIGIFVAQELAVTGKETIHEARRRLSEESDRLTGERRAQKNPISPQNTDITAAELFGTPDPYEAVDWETNPHVL